jgi:hypothetical protein
MGTPGRNFLLSLEMGEDGHGAFSGTTTTTYVCTEIFYVFAIVSYEDKSVPRGREGSQHRFRGRGLGKREGEHGRVGSFSQDFLPEMTRASTFDAVEEVIYPRRRCC